MGAAYEAGRKSEKEFKYPLPTENDTDKTDFIHLVHEILMFLQPEKDLPIFYTRDRDVFHVKMVLNAIFTRCGESSETLDAIHVYPAERLLYRLEKKSTELFNIGHEMTSPDFKMPLLSDPYAKEEFRREYEPIEACEFHCGHDKIRYCALAKVNGLGYLIAQYCCDKRHYEMIEGQHKPKRLRSMAARDDMWI